MDPSMVSRNKAIPDDIRTEEMPAQEKLTLDAQDALLLTAEQVYAQRLNETRPEGDLSSSAFIP